MKLLSNIYLSLKQMESHVPYIPDFSNLQNIGKIILVSFWICVIYTFTLVNSYDNFYSLFWHNIQRITPYITMELVLLVLFSKIINKIKPFYSIIFIVFLDLISIYFIHSIYNQSYMHFFYNIKESLIVFYISIGIIFIFLIYFDWREKNLDPANNLAKLIFLQSKMRPHFLFNTLTSTISLIKKDGELAKKMLLNLSELLRVSIKEEDITSMYTLKEELNLCEKYLDIEKIRLGERLQIKKDISEELMNAQVPKLFLQPLIENSILHGIQSFEEGGVIEIKISKNLINRIIFEIKNPIKNKMDNKEKIKRNNIALSNIKQRLNIYYNNNIIFKNEQQNSEYYVYIEIPYLIKN